MHRCRDLRVEHLDRPLAVDVERPRFSWIADHAQTEYRLSVTDSAGAIVWDSGIVPSSNTVLIPFDGPVLLPDDDYTWRVTSWSDEGSLNAESSFGTAPDLGAWDSPWIEPDQQPTEMERWTMLDWIRGASPETDIARRLRPVKLMRQRITLDQAPVRARLHMTARGIYSAWMNGSRVGDEVLAPGFDSYEHRISVQTYDVTSQLHAGENALGVALADGWWAGRIGLTGSSAQFGDRTSATWRIALTFSDGRTDVIRSDVDVTASAGPWQYADLFIGERYDAREVSRAWLDPHFDDSAWSRVTEHGVDAVTLVAFTGEPVRRVRELKAIDIRAEEKGWIVDFGQVIAGRVRLELRGLPSGAEVIVEHTETLDANGSWFVNIAGINKDQTDVYVSDGIDARWEPEFTFHGFRYARITGVKDLTSADVTAIVIGSDLDYAGRFSTSDSRINRLHENVVWSQRSNFLSVPTDCPQRERAGWTGDFQVFVAAATNNARIAPFASRWLDNLRSDQLSDGRVPIISPYSAFDLDAAEQGHGFGSIVAAAGWSDAIAIVPWALYERYGDERVLAENYDAVLAWIEYQTSTASSAFVDGDMTPERRARHALLYNTGEHFGDWLTPSTMEGKPTHEAIGIAPALTSELVAPMFQAHTLTLASKMARVLGRPEGRELERRAATVRSAFAAEYVRADGSMTVELQGMYALALGLGMIPDELRAAAASRLASLVRERGTRLDTGFLSVPYLLDALWDSGYRDLARELLWQDRAPSWLYEVDRGATTVWEAWDAIAPDGTIRPVSFNHYAFGCVDDWLFRRIAGISLAAPGWRRARIEPDFESGVDHAEATVPTPHGELTVSWSRDADDIDIRVSVPFGVHAELILDGTAHSLAAGDNVHKMLVSRNHMTR